MGFPLLGLVVVMKCELGTYQGHIEFQFCRVSMSHWTIRNRSHLGLNDQSNRSTRAHVSYLTSLHHTPSNLMLSTQAS